MPPWRPAPPPLLQTGEICLDILKNAWSPAWTLHSVCQAVLALMSDPAADSPLNCDAGARPRVGQPMRKAGQGRGRGGAFGGMQPGPAVPPTQRVSRRAVPGEQGQPAGACCWPPGSTLPRLLPSAGNLLRGNDIRGYNSMARMYTVEHATAL
jgi:hypothetical protein